MVLDDPPREQTIEANAYGDGGRELGSDRVVVNCKPVPFLVRITALESDPEDSSLHVEADVSVPRDAKAGSGVLDLHVHA